MITPQILKEQVAEICSQIPEIKKKIFVVTDDELSEFLSDHKNSENILLMSVLPNYNGYGEEDDAGVYSFLLFFFLEKVDNGSFKKQDEYLAVFDRTLAAAEKFLKQIFGVNVLNCSNEQLQYDWSIKPVSHTAQCNGHQLEINSKAFMDL